MRSRQICIKVVFLAALGSCTVVPARSAHIAPGIWGGEHVILTISQDGSTLEFDCASGQTRETLTVDKNGNFGVVGTFMPEHVGPVRKDENTLPQPAIYSGHVEGDTMTLKVVRKNADPGMFTLTRGAHPMLTKCR